MIPKKIHYCWFGHNPKPKLAKKCIKSWKKYCPDYEIIEWNEDNFDISSSPLYVRQAYEAKKWAFVTDYVRLYALTMYGGIYMDTDVEVTKNLDVFLKHEAFSGFEDNEHILTGIMACEKDNRLFKGWLKEYDKLLFVNEDGTYNMQTNVVTITNSMKKMGMKLDNSFQIIDGCAFYPNDYFCPKDFYSNMIVVTENTHTIHHFSGSWLDKETQKKHRKNARKRIREIRIDRIKHTPNRVLKRLLGDEKYEMLKVKLKGSR